MAGMIARALRIAAERVAEPGGIRFTERQLYYELCRVLRPWHRVSRRVPFPTAPPVSYSDFRELLGPVPGLLPPPEPLGAPGRHTTEPDLFDYGLPRLLVCQSAAVADMLRANGLPMESACPVYSLGDLPLDERVVSMLARVDGTVYVLHDASTAGLAVPGLMPAGVRVSPLGLNHRQAATLHLTHGRGPDGRFAEVEAVRPAVLLRTVHRLVREVRPQRPQWMIGREVGFLTWPRGGDRG
jgi:hypothetical protein